MKIYLIRDRETGRERTIYGKQTRFFVCVKQAQKQAKRAGAGYVVDEYELVPTGEMF